MCPICAHRPKVKDSMRCRVCERRLIRARAEEKARREWWRAALKGLPPDAKPFAVWRGYGVAFLSAQGGGRIARPLTVTESRAVPKGRTLLLDTYCDGYTREQVKRIKRAILQAHHLQVA